LNSTLAISAFIIIERLSHNSIPFILFIDKIYIINFIYMDKSRFYTLITILPHDHYPYMPTRSFGSAMTST
jgi:hypothetical protein